MAEGIKRTWLLSPFTSNAYFVTSRSQWQARTPTCRARCPGEGCRTCMVDHLQPLAWAGLSIPTDQATTGGSETWRSPGAPTTKATVWCLECFFCLLLRPDHVMGMDGSMGPPGSQHSMGPSNSESSMYSPSRYPAQQRSALVSALLCPIDNENNYWGEKKFHFLEVMALVLFLWVVLDMMATVSSIPACHTECTHRECTHSNRWELFLF